MSVRPARYSLPFVIVETIAIGIVMGAWSLTVLDPLAQNLFASATWVSSTSYGSNTLTWLKYSWTYLPIFIMFGIMFQVWVYSRRGGL